MLSKDDADRSLGGLAGARDRIAAQMYAIDTHPAWARLRTGTATGETQRRYQTLRPEVDWLWAYFGALRDALERATALRSGRRPGDPAWAELTTLLTGPTVSLDADGMPVDPAAGTAVASTATLTGLAAQTEQHCVTVLAQLSEVDTAWTAVTTEFGRVTAAVEDVVRLATELGATDVATSVRGNAAGIERLDLTDPLSAAPAGRLAAPTQARCDAVLAATEAARAGLTELVRAREQYPRRRDALAALIDQVAGAEALVAQANRRAQEKIADPGLAPLPTAATVLRGRLTELDRLRSAAQWTRLAADLSTMEDSAARARDRAIELRAAADGLIGRRDELRGRLEAYRAKAAALGHAEDATLATAFDQAHELLFTAPCDLRAATRAVHAYQTALSTQTAQHTSQERSPVDDRRL